MGVMAVNNRLQVRVPADLMDALTFFLRVLGGLYAAV